MIHKIAQLLSPKGIVILQSTDSGGVLSRAGASYRRILEAFGSGFAASRSVTLAFLVLPVIGLLERYGLQQRARALVSKAASLTAGRLLVAYLLFRQVTAAFGLTSIGGTPQMVRPLIYPMAEGAVIRTHGAVPEAVTETIKANAAAADTIGVFFGEDCFVAIGSVLLIAAYVSYHLKLDPLQIAIWAVPTAIAAFLIHGFRLLRLDAKVARMIDDRR